MAVTVPVVKSVIAFKAVTVAIVSLVAVIATSDKNEYSSLSVTNAWVISVTDPVISSEVTFTATSVTAATRDNCAAATEV